ncbi:MAG: hypothetical protein CL804_09715 [Citromicrobium sp.]|nr:hypothetical protein [Citromicrobium sp.]|tara:strand:+ start:6760 stop:7200 length:441 start_codon:yes stop_codon:yes gene_type:complete
MIFLVAQLAFLIVAASLAFARGGGPEKVVAGILCAWFAGNGVLRYLYGASTYRSFEGWIFVSEVIALALFVVIALWANRYWTLWLASVQLIAVLGHVLGWVGLTQHPLVYAIFTQTPFWLAILLLLFGSLGDRAPGWSSTPWRLSN